MDPVELRGNIAAAVGLDPQRGDTIRLSTLPFDRSAEEGAAAELEAAAAADAKASQMSLFRNIGLGVLVLAMVVLAAFKGRRRSKQRQDATTYVVEQLRADAQARAQQQAALEAATAATAATALEPGAGSEAEQPARRARRARRAPARGRRGAAARLARGAPLMSATIATHAGVRKAAVLMIQMGRERAARVLSHLSEAEVEAISAEIARLDSVAGEETERVLGEFREMAAAQAHIAKGGLGFAQALLEQSLGSERAAEIIDRLNAAAVQMPFQFLRRADPAQIRSFIVDEHPQVIALVLAHMTPDKASLLLSGLPPEQQAQVAHRIAVMDRTSPDIVRAVESSLERKLSSMLQPSEMSRVGGLDPLVTIINRADRSTERQIVEGLEALDPALADEVRSRMFMFEDVVNLDDRAVQQVLRQVDSAELALALKGVSDQVRSKITENLSSRAAENLLEEVELLGAVRLAQVEEAQQSIIRTIRTLEERGEITVRRGGEDDFVV